MARGRVEEIISYGHKFVYSLACLSFFSLDKIAHLIPFYIIGNQEPYKMA